MPPLHATLTATALPNVHVKPPHDRLHRWEVFLILRGHARLDDGAATRGTRRRQRYVVDLVHDRGWAPLALPPVPRAALPAGPARMPLRRALREGRGLPRARTAGRLQFLFQTGILALEFSTLAFRLFQIAPELFVLAAQFLDRLRESRRTITTVGAHAPFMPESARQYKC
jgi:hypothetical protein